MFKRNKNDKGKQSQETRMKISQKLKAKARGLRSAAKKAADKGAKAVANTNTAKGLKKDVKNVYSEGLAKGLGGVGYAAGLASSTKPMSRKERQASMQKAENFNNTKAGQVIQKASVKAFDASNRGTRLKAVNEIIKGAEKGQADRKKLANKEDEVKNKFKR